MQNYQNHGYSESPAPSDNTILWTASVTGDLHEFPTPVVVNGIVYYPSNYGTDSLYTLDAATGELIWNAPVLESSTDVPKAIDSLCEVLGIAYFHSIDYLTDPNGRQTDRARPTRSERFPAARETPPAGFHWA